MPPFFTKTVKLEPKSLSPQPPLNHEHRTTISTLHTYHRLLPKYIWPDAIIESTHTQSNRTTFLIHVAGHRTVDFKVTFTNLPSGLSLCQWRRPPCLRRATVYWKVTKGDNGMQGGSDAAGGGDGELWCLEESAEISFFRWVTRYIWLSDVYQGMKMRKVLMVFDRIAGSHAGMRRAGASD